MCVCAAMRPSQCHGDLVRHQIGFRHPAAVTGITEVNLIGKLVSKHVVLGTLYQLLDTGYYKEHRDVAVENDLELYPSRLKVKMPSFFPGESPRSIRHKADILITGSCYNATFKITEMKFVKTHSSINMEIKYAMVQRV